MFSNFFFEADDGFYTLTKGGSIVFALIMVALIVIAAFIFDRNSVKHSTKELVITAMLIALAYAVSFVKISMPFGGSVTMFSMLFVCLIAYFYGPKMGLAGALAYGVLQFIQDGGSYVLSPMQVCCDYLFAFMGLGVAGFFANCKKHALIKGYIAGITMRFVFASLAGYLYWMESMPEEFPKSLKAIYPLVYNGLYIYAEGIVTVLVLLVPAVAGIMVRTKNIVRAKQ
jgi:thiamine transporter